MRALPLKWSLCAILLLSSFYLWGQNTYCSDCYAYVIPDSVGEYLTAHVWGASCVPPYSYLWSNGSVASSAPLSDFNTGDYCVTITDAEGCTTTACLDSCYVFLEQVGDTIFAMPLLPDDLPTYSFEWQDGSTNPFILVTEPGEYCVTLYDLPQCISTACLEVGDGTTAVHETGLFPEEIRLFPNPLAKDGELSVRVRVVREVDAQIRLLNLQGYSVFDKFVSFRQGENALKLHLGELPPGVYFLFFYTDEGALQGEKLFVE